MEPVWGKLPRSEREREREGREEGEVERGGEGRRGKYHKIHLEKKIEKTIGGMQQEANKGN